MNDFVTIVTNTQIATALVLIAAFLAYIAFRLSGTKKGSRSSKR